MGNIIGANCCMASEGQSVKVIYWEGNKKTLTGKRRLAGEIMFEFPESMVCDADRFFIGHAIPALSIGDHLRPGKTYFVLPLDIFSSEIFSSSSISAFAAYTPRRTLADLKDCPLEYLKGANGRVLIKVKPEFMAQHLTSRGECHDDGRETDGITMVSDVTNGLLCSTPELKKEYEMLVGLSKVQTWSPNLDTISEAKKLRYSPYRLFGLEQEEKEDDAFV